MVEAATCCLDHNGHTSGVSLGVSGDLEDRFDVDFIVPTNQVRSTWNDQQEMTEEGAVAVAVAVLLGCESYEVVERSRKGTGFDYWLGAEEGDFSVRLEVSGILTGNKSQVQTRLKQKLAQMEPTDKVAPGYAVVVEFSDPQACVARKE